MTEKTKRLSLFERLRSQRLSLGLTQRQVSDELGLDRSYLSKIERGLIIINYLSYRKLSNFYKSFIPFEYED